MFYKSQVILPNFCTCFLSFHLQGGIIEIGITSILDSSQQVLHINWQDALFVRATQNDTASLSCNKHLVHIQKRVWSRLKSTNVNCRFKTGNETVNYFVVKSIHPKLLPLRTCWLYNTFTLFCSWWCCRFLSCFCTSQSSFALTQAVVCPLWSEVLVDGHVARLAFMLETTQFVSHRRPEIIVCFFINRKMVTRMRLMRLHKLL